MFDRKPYLIAEIGVNFYDTARELEVTPMDAAKLYIDRAQEAGIDCVKFQSYKANTIASKYSPAYWDTTKETTKSQYELFKKYDSFGEREFGELSEYAHIKGLDFVSTPFDYFSADYLFDMVDFYKISSSDLNNIPFIKHIAKKGKRVVLSVGASYISEVDEAIRALNESGCREIALLHCVLAYPTAAVDANLSVIKTLKRMYPDLNIGYSDHVVPDERMITLSAAYLLGAEIIEKHFTLNKTLPGNDHYHAGSPEDFKKAIENFKWIDLVMGSGNKIVFACEEESRRQARRSLVLTRDIMEGDMICESDIMSKRPGIGIAPSFQDVIVGRCVKKSLKEDSILTWDDI